MTGRSPKRSKHIHSFCTTSLIKTAFHTQIGRLKTRTHSTCRALINSTHFFIANTYQGAEIYEIEYGEDGDASGIKHVMDLEYGLNRVTNCARVEETENGKKLTWKRSL